MVGILYKLLKMVPNLGVHSLQVAFLASEIAKELGMDYLKAFKTGYLHDIGVLAPHQKVVLDDINTSFLIHHDVSSLDEMVRIHTVVGSFIFGQSNIFADIADIVLKHHALPKFLSEDSEEDIYANIISISEEISKYHFINKEVGFDDIFYPLVSIQNRFLDNIFNTAVDLIKREYVLWTLEDIRRGIVRNELIISEKVEEINVEQLVEIGVIASFIVDAKSRFTKEHSWRVAKVASRMAEVAKLNEKDFFIAGLFHDIGKITTPIGILEKKGKLTSDEMEIMKKHVYYSYLILLDYSKQPWFWPAVRHQERTNGKGYPWKLTKKEMTFEDEIMQTADYFSAFLEERPYREAFNTEDAFKMVVKASKNGLLSKESVEILNEILKSKEDFSSLEYVTEFQRNINLFVQGLIQ